MQKRAFLAVRITGLEPARGYHQNLNLARLPIPPYPLVLLSLRRRRGKRSGRPVLKQRIKKAAHTGKRQLIDETWGDRTPDNLIKSQVLYQLS